MRLWGHQAHATQGLFLGSRHEAMGELLQHELRLKVGAKYRSAEGAGQRCAPFGAAQEEGAKPWGSIRSLGLCATTARQADARALHERSCAN